MPFRLQIWATSLAGLVAAIAGWAIMDVGLQTGNLLTGRNGELPEAQGIVYYIYVASFAFLLGIAAGFADATFRETNAQRRNSVLTGVACGIIAALFGPALAIGLSRLVPSRNEIDQSSITVFTNVVLMSFGWAVIGGLAGSIHGIGRRSRVATAWGATGGIIGGLVGGLLFQLGLYMFDREDPSGSIWRLGSLIVTGVLSGVLSLCLMDANKQAWLIRLGIAAQNRRYVIGRSSFRIGDASNCDIVIAGDSGVAPVHVVVEAIPATRRHRLRHAARSPSGQARYAATMLNGESMTSEKWLVDGDSIKIGGSDFHFREKGTRIEIADFGKTPPPPTVRATIPETLTVMGSAGVSEAGSVEYEPPGGLSRGPSGPEFLDDSERFTHASDMPVSIRSNGAIGTRFACIAGPYRGQSFPLRHETITIGRASDLGISLPADTSVSATHARIAYEAGRHVISDADSANGVWLNSRRLAEAQILAIADIVTIGATLLRYE